MAYDPEARRQSNAALIVGLVALLVVGGAALAYFATRQAAPEPGPATVVQGRDKTIVVTQTAVPGPTAVAAATTPATVLVVPVPVTGGTTRNTTPSGGTGITSPPSGTQTSRTASTPPAPVSNQTNVTINNVQPTTAPATRTTGTGRTGTGVSGTGTTGTESGTTTNSAAPSADTNTATSNSATTSATPRGY